MTSSATDDFIIKKSSILLNDLFFSIKQLINQGLSPDAIQVLSPQRDGLSGCDYLNLVLKKILNPSATATPSVDTSIPFTVGDRVIQIRNNYRLVKTSINTNSPIGKGVYNGTIGKVVDIYQGGLSVRFDDCIVHYTDNQLDQLDLAYCLTVHKYQGSQNKAIITILSKKHSPTLLTKRLLYTAITRAEEHQTIITDFSDTDWQNLYSRDDKRNSELGSLLAQALPPSKNK